MEHLKSSKRRDEMPGPIITLLTDFGLEDGYAGAMKGVILSICPQANLVDITHLISPGEIRSGAYVLHSVYGTFPAGSIHVGVVDPGVGSSRKPVVIRAGKHTFIGPDNGLFSWVLKCEPTWTCRGLTNEGTWRPSVSRTFHGRDIFAPVAAHLANGFSLEALGPLHDPLVSDWVMVAKMADGLRGQVIHVDRFGNAVTNVREDDLPAEWRSGGWRVLARGTPVKRAVGTYSDAPPGMPIALLGSCGHLEIAVNHGDASRLLDLSPGDPVTVVRVASNRVDSRLGEGTPAGGA